MSPLCKHIQWRLYVTDAYQQTSLCDPRCSLALLSDGADGQRKTDTTRQEAKHLNHFVAVGLGVSSRHGKDPDLLCLGAAVSQRQRHLSVGGAVCGVGPGHLEKHQSQSPRGKKLLFFCVMEELGRTRSFKTKSNCFQFAQLQKKDSAYKVEAIIPTGAQMHVRSHYERCDCTRSLTAPLDCCFYSHHKPL